MAANSSKSSVDDFASSRAALALAFAWGFAEATFFFIVPDVLLTLIACRNLRTAIGATLAALGGALAGGVLMFTFGANAPETMHLFLDHVPAISPALVAQVATQIDESGLLAVMLGPIKGIPYKIYAVEWGARGGGLVSFLLISIPARYVRFIAAASTARAIARLIEPLSHHSVVVEATILAIIWTAFYGFYFSRFGL